VYDSTESDALEVKGKAPPSSAERTSETPSWQRVVGDMKDAVIGKRASADDMPMSVNSTVPDEAELSMMGTSQVTAPSRFEKFACPIEATIDETESTGAGIETTRLRTSSLG